MEQLELHILLNIHWRNHFKKVFGSVCQAECMYILSLSNSISRPILNRNAYIHKLKDTYKSVQSDCINNNTPPTKHPSVIQWINNLCCIQTMKITNYCYVQIVYESYKDNVKRKQTPKSTPSIISWHKVGKEEKLIHDTEIRLLIGG